MHAYYFASLKLIPIQECSEPPVHARLKAMHLQFQHRAKIHLVSKACTHRHGHTDAHTHTQTDIQTRNLVSPSGPFLYQIKDKSTVSCAHSVPTTLHIITWWA